MIRIWIKQVLDIFINFFWINEDSLKDFPTAKTFFKENWIISLYKYKSPIVKNSIWQMKYRANKDVAWFLGKKMTEIIIKNNLEDYILVPIPIHWRRRAERGFNQSEWLCQAIVKNNKIKYEKVLKRVVYSKKQSWNNKSSRQRNVKSVFKIRNNFLSKISDQKFLIIDDVVTTGATLKEARQELLIQGAISVKALTVAF